MNAVRRTAQTLHICWNPRHFRPQALTLQYSTSLYLYTLQQQYCTGNNNTVIERWMGKKNLYCIVQWSWICCLNWENVLYWKRYWQTRTSVHPVQWLCTHTCTVKCSRLKQVLHLPQETVAYTGGHGVTPGVVLNFVARKQKQKKSEPRPKSNGNSASLDQSNIENQITTWNLKPSGQRVRGHGVLSYT